jgi:hypothetical protein
MTFIEAQRAQMNQLITETIRQFERDLFFDGSPKPPPEPSTWEDRYRDKWMDEFRYDDEDWDY